MSKDFFRGKRVFVTGHTGFKGTWLSLMLTMKGAEVTGYALEPAGSPDGSLFHLSGVERDMHSVIGDVRDIACLQRTLDEADPEIIFHLAAQPIVLESYQHPVETYTTNVMGTVNLLECARKNGSVKCVVNVTTDKVYKNREWVWGYRETDELGGKDPYSNSKSCSELVTASYRENFFLEKGVTVSTVRAGNVIGGGDMAPHRIIPDCIRAAFAGNPILVRNPFSIRPYQHVLEALMAYLMVCEAQYSDISKAGSYNVGPDETDCIATGELAELFCGFWGENLSWKSMEIEDTSKESRFLKLDSSKIRNDLGWRPRWDIREAVGRTVEWAKIHRAGRNVRICMENQIMNFCDTKTRYMQPIRDGYC